MRTYKRICIEDYIVEDEAVSFTLKRGKEYITTPEDNGTVTVFTNYWLRDIPAKIFVAEKVFTKA